MVFRVLRLRRRTSTFLATKVTSRLINQRMTSWLLLLPSYLAEASLKSVSMIRPTPSQPQGKRNPLNNMFLVSTLREFLELTAPCTPFIIGMASPLSLSPTPAYGTTKSPQLQETALVTLDSNPDAICASSSPTRVVLITTTE